MSGTLRDDFLHVARKAILGGKTEGFVRMSSPLTAWGLASRS
jgi:hypothetical protein